MYCANCGVKLADSENQCPLCATPAFHPNIQRQPGQRLYPQGELKTQKVSPWITLIIATTIYLLPMLTVLIADWQLNHKITWSGYVVGAMLACYVCLVLPFWFPRPNPVIFVPCGFGAVALFLMYVDWSCRGGWFYSFALPVVAAIGGIVTAVTVLMRHFPGSRLYIFGGAALGLGLFMPVMECLLVLTFQSIAFVGWSFYPLLSLGLLGGLLIFLAICRPARETMERKFFI